MQFLKALETAHRHAITFVDKLDHNSVAATVDVGTLRSRLTKRLSAAGLPPAVGVASS